MSAPANEVREGIKHVGAFKKGGKVHKLGGGTIGDNPISMQDRSMSKATGMMKKGGRAKKRADGGDVIGDMIRQDQIEQGMKGRGQPARVPTPPVRPTTPPAKVKDPIPNNINFGAKRGGKIKHSDEAEDKALIKKMVKSEARTGRKTGGGVFSGDSKQKIPATGGRKASQGWRT
jgi:hypothetical protein